MKKLYDGGILIFVGLVLIAIGIAAAGTGIKRVNKSTQHSKKEQSKPIIIPLPERSEPAPYDVLVPVESKSEPREEPEFIIPDQIPPKEIITMDEERPWYWPF